MCESGNQEVEAGVMTNFLCQLGWTWLPRYLIRHYPRCFCEYIFGWDLHLNQWTLSKANCSTECRWTSFNQWKVWIEQKPDLSGVRGNSARRLPLDFICNIGSSWFSSRLLLGSKLHVHPDSLACQLRPSDFGLAKPPQLCGSTL